MSLRDAIARAVSEATGTPFKPDGRTTVGGGCINSTEILRGGEQRFFVKLNDSARLAMFEAEAEGLHEIAASNSVRVPHPICSGTHGGQSYLVLEYLDFGCVSAKSDALLGRQLAAMHRVTHALFGWRRDNTIGSTPQINNEETDWVDFYREHRLRFQLELAARNGYGGNLLRRGERLLEELPAFFASYSPQPSLLHGDLWGGNHAALRDGSPVIFDPAVYYGDREADLAMTQLFGGFSADFYAAYRESWPLDSGYRMRADLYNLYHVLNHLNLFGGGYRGQAEQTIERLFREIG
jgi:protein-ribulosamine 3-kinase